MVWFLFRTSQGIWLHEINQDKKKKLNKNEKWGKLHLVNRQNQFSTIIKLNYPYCILFTNYPPPIKTWMTAIPVLTMIRQCVKITHQTFKCLICIHPVMSFHVSVSEFHLSPPALDSCLWPHCTKTTDVLYTLPIHITLYCLSPGVQIHSSWGQDNPSL